MLNVNYENCKTKVERADALASAYEQINCYVKPTKGIDSGAMGKSFDVRVKAYLNGNKGKSDRVTPNTCKYDLYFHSDKIEAKSASGSLSNIIYNNPDFVIYSIDSTIDNARVFTKEVFLELLNKCRLYRLKADRKTGEMKPYIQTFKFQNSTSKYKQWERTLNSNGISIAEYKAIYNG